MSTKPRIGRPVPNKWRKRGTGSEQSPPASVKLLVSLPEDELVAGELELIQAHLAGLLDRVFPPEVDTLDNKGKDEPWP